MNEMIKGIKTTQVNWKIVNWFIQSMTKDNQNGFETISSSFHPDTKYHKFKTFKDNPLYGIGCGWRENNHSQQFNIGI
jgi:hypothetical protein